MRQSSCKNGCNSCCYKLVEITPLEAAHIRQYIFPEYESEWKEKIKSAKKITPTLCSLELGMEEERKKTLARPIIEKISCGFLTDDRLCTKYQKGR